jgi:hypothetical protein
MIKSEAIEMVNKIDGWVLRRDNESEVELDGEFSIEEIEAILFLLKNSTEYFRNTYGTFNV